MSKDVLNEVTENITNASAREREFTKSITVNGVPRTGVFTAKVPSLMQRIQIGVNRSKLLGGAPSESLDQFTDDLAFMMSYLEVVMITKPKWFNWDLLEDFTEIKELFYEVSNWVNTFQRKRGEDTNGEGGQPTSHEKNMVGDEDI